MYFPTRSGENTLQKARILIADKGAKSLNGGDWLNAFTYPFVSPNQKEGNNAIHKVTTNCSLQTKTTKAIEAGKQTEVANNNNITEHTKLKKQFKELFERQEKLISLDIKIEFKTNAKITQKGYKGANPATGSCRRRI